MDSDDNKIEMRATVPKSLIKRPLNELDDTWSVDGDNFVKVWTQADASSGAFTTDDDNNLVWTEEWV